jgi:hypothetical protein
VITPRKAHDGISNGRGPQEIEKYYKDHVSAFTTQEEVSLSEILILTELDSKAAEARVAELERMVDTTDEWIRPAPASRNAESRAG